MRVTVWNENIHEKEMPEVTELYPGGLHAYIAGFLKSDDVEVRTATLDEPECGLTKEVLEDTDVLIWWGHAGHDRVPDEVVERVQRAVLSGMGLVVLHSGHHSKIFRKMLGTTCNLKWRDGARERIWTVKPNHPIAAGIPESFALDCEEMYGEPFDIADPQDYGDILNRSWVFRTVGYGHGKEVWNNIISALKAVGYDGAISIEHEDGLMSPKEGLEKAVALLKDAIIYENAGEMWWA